MTSSPGWISKRIADISRAEVQDVVRRLFLAERAASIAEHVIRVYAPSPDVWDPNESRRTSCSKPVMFSLEKGIMTLSSLLIKIFSCAVLSELYKFDWETKFDVHY
jgi:hypothetical protein